MVTAWPIGTNLGAVAKECGPVVGLKSPDVCCRYSPFQFRFNRGHLNRHHAYGVQLCAFRFDLGLGRRGCTRELIWTTRCDRDQSEVDAFMGGSNDKDLPINEIIFG